MSVEVGIIIPIYNCEKYLDECLNSVLNQSYSAINVILVNDGSTDGSLEICRRYMALDSRVLLLSQKNLGVSEARNNGLKNVTTQFIMFLDSDDILESTVIEKLVNEMTSNDVQLAVCGLRCFSGKNQNILEWKYSSGLYSMEDYLPVLLKFRTIPFVGGPVAKLYLKEIIEKNQINFEKDQSFAEDFVFNMKYLRFVDNISVIDSSFYLRREDNVNSLSKSTRLQIPLWERKKQVFEEWVTTIDYVSDKKYYDTVLIQKFAVKSILDVCRSPTEASSIEFFIQKVFNETENYLIGDSKKIRSYKMVRSLYLINKKICIFLLKVIANPKFYDLSLIKRLNK